jgi:hypothetical protein
MELFLNLLWLLIAAALLCTWRTQWVHDRRRTPRRRIQEWSAVCLALVLLFFAVSMSDDMHSEIVALEESSLSKRDQLLPSTSHPLVQPKAVPHTPLWATMQSVASDQPLACSTTVAAEATSFAHFAALNSLCGRAPPVSVL